MSIEHQIKLLSQSERIELFKCRVSERAEQFDSQTKVAIVNLGKQIVKLHFPIQSEDDDEIPGTVSENWSLLENGRTRSMELSSTLDSILAMEMSLLSL